MGLSKLANRKSRKESAANEQVINSSDVFTGGDFNNNVNPNQIDYAGYEDVEPARKPVEQHAPINEEYIPQHYQSPQPRRYDVVPSDVRHSEVRVIEDRHMGSRIVDNRNINDFYNHPVDPVNREMSMGRRMQDTMMDPRFQSPGNEIVDRRYQRVGSLEIPGISEFGYSNPDKYGLQVLGLNSSEKVRLLKPKSLEIKPMIINNIVDAEGRVADKLLKYMDKFATTVLPLRECGVFENITSIEGFKIIEIKGKKYASYCGSNYPTIHRQNLVNEIVNRISCAQPYGAIEDLDRMGGYIWNREESRLSRFVTIHGKEVEVPALCNSEIEYICALFANYHCNIIEVNGDFPHIIVGIDLEGMGFGEQEAN